MTGAIVRSYQSEDEEAVRKICGDTAFFGQKIEQLINDRELIVDALILYYTKFEPESLFIIEQECEVAGYLSGCVDTKKYESTFSRRILPLLVKQFFTHGHWYTPSSWQIFSAYGKTVKKRQHIINRILDTYPAHCHMNLSRKAQHKGFGSQLYSHFLQYLVQQDIKGIHVSTATEAGKAFFRKKGFIVLEKHQIPKFPIDAPKENWLMGRKI
jgi:hypothetical protein